MSVATVVDVRRAVDEAWAARPESSTSWPDPHPDRAPLEQEYSRVTEPERYVVVGARARAWVDALTGLGLADARTPEDGTVRLVPRAPGALPLDVVSRALDDVPGSVVDLLVGDPPTPVVVLPDCGCDACDSGSADLLDAIDDAFVGVLGGGFVLIESEHSRIVATAGGWSASGASGDVAAAVAAARRGERRPDRRTLVGGPWWAPVVTV